MRHLRAIVNLIAIVLIVLATIRLSDRRTSAPPESIDSSSILDRRVGPLEIHNLSLDDATERLGRAAGAQIVIDDSSPSMKEVLSTGKFSLDIHGGKSLDAALEALVQSGAHGLGYFVERGQVRLTTQVRVPLITRVYDVRDIWRWVIDEVPPEFDEFRMEDARLSPARHVGPALMRSAKMPPLSRQQAIEAEAMYRLECLVWNSKGVDGRLIVTQTAEGHRSFVELLQIIRQMHNHPATVDGRGN